MHFQNETRILNYKKKESRSLLCYIWKWIYKYQISNEFIERIFDWYELLLIIETTYVITYRIFICV